MDYSIEKLREKYDLEIEKILKEIKENKAKTVLIQLPDGLKPYGTSLADFIEKNTSAIVRIYLGDCFGACDVPSTKCDMVIQFGHAPWE